LTGLWYSNSHQAIGRKKFTSDTLELAEWDDKSRVANLRRSDQGIGWQVEFPPESGTMNFSGQSFDS